MKPKPILAIDVGSSKVACAIGQPQPAGGGVELVGSGLSSYPLSCAWPGEPAVMAKTIEQAIEDARVAPWPDRVVVALTHPELSHERVVAQIDVADEPMLIRSRELARLRAQAVSQALGLDRDVLYLEALGYAGNGFEGVRDPKGLVATRLSGTFQLIAVPLAVRRALTQALETLGLEAEQTFYGLKALAAACLPAPQDDGSRPGNILLVDIGGCCTDLAVVDQGRLARSASIAWGGAALIEAIAKECRCTMEQALPISLEGLQSPRPKVRQLVEQQLKLLQRHIRHLLEDSALPNSAVVTGRGALIDGVVESVGQMAELPAALGRSRRTQRVGDLSRQIALNTAVGLLELSCPSEGPQRPQLPRFVDRLLARTKTILIDYF